MRRFLVVLALVLIAGCGGDASETTPATTETTPATASTTTVPVSTPDTGQISPSSTTTPTPPATVPPATNPPATPDDPTQPDPTLPPPATTTTVVADGALGRPDPALLEALPAEMIPWDEVGSDWLAFAYPRHTTTLWEETGRQGLYLVDPDDRIYGVSALPADGTDVAEVSWSGRVALLRGPFGAGRPLYVLDLQTTTVREIELDIEDLDHYALTRNGTGLWVYDLPWSNPPEGDGTASVTHLDLATLARTTLLEETVALDAHPGYYQWWVNNRGGVVELTSGDIVVGLPSGVWMTSLDRGDPRRLELPDAACAAADVWDDATVLVRCAIPEPTQCEDDESELWLVPVDGRTASLLATPADECVGYDSAFALGDHLAVDAGFGSGECNGHVLVIDPGGTVERWVPPLQEVNCNEWLIGVRNDAWLMQAANPYVDRDFPIALFEVTPDGARPIDLPAVWVTPLTP